MFRGDGVNPELKRAASLSFLVLSSSFSSFSAHYLISSPSHRAAEEHQRRSSRTAWTHEGTCHPRKGECGWLPCCSFFLHLCRSSSSSSFSLSCFWILIFGPGLLGVLLLFLLLFLRLLVVAIVSLDFFRLFTCLHLFVSVFGWLVGYQEEWSIVTRKNNKRNSLFVWFDCLVVLVVV